jgi:hypothetical protein
MHVRVDRPGRDDAALARDDIGRGADDHVDAVADVGVARMTDADDPSVADPDVGADDPPPVEDDCVGDDGVEGAVGPSGRRLRHRFADRLPAAEDRLFTADRQVFLDLDPQIGVAQAHLVADRRAVDRGVSRAVNPHHRASPDRRT